MPAFPEKDLISTAALKSNGQAHRILQQNNGQLNSLNKKFFVIKKNTRVTGEMMGSERKPRNVCAVTGLV